MKELYNKEIISDVRGVKYSLRNLQERLVTLYNELFYEALSISRKDGKELEETAKRIELLIKAIEELMRLYRFIEEITEKMYNK